MSWVSPGDAEITTAYEQWRQALAGGSPTATEWREMYLALLCRKDQLAAGEQYRQDQLAGAIPA